MEGKIVFLFTIDALRPDHLKCYGYNKNTAPNLEKFISNGTTFCNAFTNGPESPSSFAGLFTGLLPYSNNYKYSPLPLEKITISQILHENGVFTYGIHSNPNLGAFFNYDRGFDIFLDGEKYKTTKGKSQEASVKTKLSKKLQRILGLKGRVQILLNLLVGFNKLRDWVRKKIPSLTDILLPFTPIAYNAPYIVNKVKNFLNKWSGDSLFLWAHFMDTHSPFNPPLDNLLKFRKKDIHPSERLFINKKVLRQPKKYSITPELINKAIALYDGEINFVDEYLGQILKYLKYKFKNRDCLIIITSDHGESFYEHGFFHHQGNIYDELLKVPLFMIELENHSNLKIVKDNVQLIDIPSTILDYFGISIPENFQGENLIPLLKGRSIERKTKYIISECFQKNGIYKRNNKDGFKLISIRKDEWKYIYDEEKESEYLYNIINDAEERIDLSNKNSLKINEFRMIRYTHLQNILKSKEESKIIEAITKLDIDKLKFKN